MEIGICCRLTQKQREDHNSGIVPIPSGVESMHWMPAWATRRQRKCVSESPVTVRPVSLPVRRAVSPHIESLAQITAFLLHRAIFIHVYVRVGQWRLWKEAKFEVHQKRMEKLLMTVCSDFSFFHNFCGYENLL